MPKPAERAELKHSKRDLERACSVAQILLVDNARVRVQLAADFARGGVGALAAKAGGETEIAAPTNSKARQILSKLLEQVKGDGKPTFVFLLDVKGRVIARAGLDAGTYGDVLKGFFAVDDALNGYLRDDLWFYKGIEASRPSLYRVATSPVFTAQLTWAGAVVVGHTVDKGFADKLGANLQSDISFFVDGNAVASNSAIQIQNELVEHFSAARSEKGEACAAKPVEITAGGSTYQALVRALPGEAGQRNAFYAVFKEKPAGIGFMGTIDAVDKGDMAFGSFPWIRLAVMFLLVVIIGMGLTYFESDRPLRRLAKDAVNMAKDEGAERLNENLHRGKYGSIARSVNIAIDKINREAKAARKEMDQLIGPAVSDSGGALPGLGLPPAPDSFAPPPPSEFKFSAGAGIPAPPPPSDNSGFELGVPKPPGGGPVASGLNVPGANPPPPPPVPSRPATPPPPVMPPIGSETPEATMIQEPSDELLKAAGRNEEDYFRTIYDDFIALKKKCGENVANLTFEKFSRKLRKNRDTLIAKHGCKSVKFQVYIKDGKAALKASPIKS
jgi:hypothetical protein